MSGRIRLFWLIFAILFAAAAVFACFYAQLFGSILIRPEGDPSETVSRFLNGIRNGDYNGAYACLSDYASLGLEQEPVSQEAAQLYAALRRSYSYTIDGTAEINGLEAVQRITLHALNLHMTEDAVAQRVNGILEEMVAALPQSEVYDPNGGYLDTLTDAVYAEALQQSLQDTTSLCTDTPLAVHLKYTNGAWKIVTDRALMTALIGGES